MIQRYTRLKVADNTGAKEAMCIGIPGFAKIRWAKIGTIVNISVREAIPNGMVKNHSVHKAVIVRTKKETRRKDGSYIRFDDNACVILELNKKVPKASRVFGPVARELKELGFDKIISLAPEVL